MLRPGLMHRAVLHLLHAGLIVLLRQAMARHGRGLCRATRQPNQHEKQQNSCYRPHRPRKITAAGRNVKPASTAYHNVQIFQA